MRPFLSRILICLIPCLIAAVIVGVAWSNFDSGNDAGLNFKLGVDLAGGTILVYEVDVDKFTDEASKDKFDAKELVAALKRRIDPNDLKNVTIRPVGKYRVEIILPTGGHSKKNFTPKEVEDTRALISQVGSLEFRILANQNDDREAIDAARAYFEGLNDPAKKEDASIKERLAVLQVRASKGQPPPPPVNPAATDPTEKYLFPWKTPFGEGRATYTWVEVGKVERHDLGLSEAAGTSAQPGSLWKQAEEARQQNRPFLVPYLGSDPFQVLMYSRPFVHKPTSDMEREDAKNKKFEYFILVRDPQSGKTIDGRYLVNSYPTEQNGKIAVGFMFNSPGGALFHEVTTANKPSGSEAGGFKRHLAIILDGKIESAPSIISPISTSGVITGSFSKEKVDQYVRIFKAGALPATLKSQAVSENTMGATLGEDTIKQGTRSVGIAFAAILLFMLVYYRFSGVVACVALLANLLLTVGFMVLVHASFTLPGLAGLVLMLGMAVDANVLIYERLREERDRGASLALAIRNGYDRAFPTIIDTHLSSIFTAIVLYAVGNDQLKGFGVSLTAGLIISLFTSLFMTRLMFDIWLAKGWLHKLSMFRLLSKTNIDFMRIRYYWFTATIILTIFGITVFLIRGPNGLNIDFVGGTAYSGRLVEPMTITSLRNRLDEPAQADRLAVASVKELPDENGEGLHFLITYKTGKQNVADILLRDRAPGATEEEREQWVARKAAELPDLSVEQIFLQSEANTGSASRYFTVRTTEKEPELVQISIDRLLREGDESLLQKIDMKNPLVQLKDNKWADLFMLPPNAAVKNPRMAVLVFSDYTSPSHVSNLLRQQFQQIDKDDPQPFELNGIKAITEEEKKNASIVGEVGEPADPEFQALAKQLGIGQVEKDGRYKLMQLILSDRAAVKVTNASMLATILKKGRDAFESRPQPERLENFDSQFAAQTQLSAIYAIVASWAVILLYLWFRFGNWTFGLATVACLVHDLFFTLGIIAFSHYLHMWVPGFATFLGMQDFKIDLPAIAALLTLVGYSVNDTIVVFDRIREVRGKNPELTPQMINDSVNQTLSRTLLTAFSVWLVVSVLYIWGGEGVHLFAFVMVVGVIVGTYSSIYIASPLLLIFGEGTKPANIRERRPEPEPVAAE